VHDLCIPVPSSKSGPFTLEVCAAAATDLIESLPRRLDSEPASAGGLSPAERHQHASRHLNYSE